MRNSGAGQASYFKKWNLSLSIIYLLEFFAFFVLSKSYSLPLTANYLAVNPIDTSVSGIKTLSASSNTVLNLNIQVFILFLLFILFVFYLLSATVFQNKFEEIENKKNPNYWNWFLKALSLSFFFVLVSISFGIYDILSLFMIFGLIAVSGLVSSYIGTTKQSKRRINWWLFCFSAVPCIAVLLVLLMYELFALNYGNTSVPSYALWSGGVLLILVAALCRSLTLSLKKFGRFSEHAYQEKYNMLVMICSYSLITWIFYFGILHS